MDGGALPKGLVFSSDSEPGIRRHRCGKGFTYRLPDGNLVKDSGTRERIRGLGIPPAYREVWICLKPNGHLQASGLDDRGRKQYRYHPDWRIFRDLLKFESLIEFGHALPRLRRIVHKGLDAPPGSFEFAAATLATLLDTFPMRIGSPAYTAENGTYGATTLRKQHVTFVNGKAHFSYLAKGGRRVRCTLGRNILNRALEEVAELPGRTLFSWLDDDDRPHELDSGDFNTYLAEAAGVPGITAKVFRTWAGTVEAFAVAYDRQQEGKPVTVKLMAEAAARRLVNTPAIARKSYIHPAVIDLAGQSAGELAARLGPLAGMEAPSGLRAAEARLLRYLEG